MSLNQHTLKPNEPKKNRKRRGRGDSSGNGSYSGKGMKGQNSRSGGGVRPGFEGGQLPLIKRLPSLRGFNNIFKVNYNVVNMDTLSRVYPDGGDVSPEDLVTLRVLKNTKSPLKILGRGELTVPVNVKAHKFSEVAVKKIEAAGGSTQVIE
ncbi:MAG: 50S ribosomal protein L15 [Dehalococcoidia bacterium]|jgi:large subunit ribosomal protein L15|tara:strand:- start:218 stop:670 length:453 start_codon:yes stop_codon:yes gene_type:complete